MTQFSYPSSCAQNAVLLRRGQGSAATLAMAAQCISSGASANKIKKTTRASTKRDRKRKKKRRSRKQQKYIWRRPHFAKGVMGGCCWVAATLTCFATFGCHFPLYLPPQQPHHPPLVCLSTLGDLCRCLCRRFVIVCIWRAFFCFRLWFSFVFAAYSNEKNREKTMQRKRACVIPSKVLLKASGS